MNLLKDRWLPVRNQDGRHLNISPAEIGEAEIIDLAAPRLDFNGALHQFLIGLLQTAFSPDDFDKWSELWDTPPSTDHLNKRFAKFASAFELFSEIGMPAFLQDLSMVDDEEKQLSSLLIDAPGGKTLKDHLDHFVKGGGTSQSCESCAATALFTLQTNAPAGGVGHRVGLRGGGPLTTLLVPTARISSLWQKLWLNVLTQKEFPCQEFSSPSADVFPWIDETRLSDKAPTSTLPEDTHALQMYWGMPRRIRLKHETRPGNCSICGKQSQVLVTGFVTRNYGVNYEGPWVHPLTPYRHDSKNEKPPLSLKGQPGGLGYRHWLAMNWGDETSGDVPSLNVKSFYAEKSSFVVDDVGLWCFGYDMDNMKARCWYEHQVPTLSVPQEIRTIFVQHIGTLLAAARDVVKELRNQIKFAWFSRPQDVKGDVSMIDASFWQATETEFYALLHQLGINAKQLRFLPDEIGKQWVLVLRRKAMDLFDYWVLEGEAENMDMKRVTKARRDLLRRLKSLKSLSALDRSNDKEAA